MGGSSKFCEASSDRLTETFPVDSGDSCDVFDIRPEDEVLVFRRLTNLATRLQGIAESRSGQNSVSVDSVHRLNNLLGDFLDGSR